MQTVTSPTTTTDQPESRPLRIRYRIRFAKTGLLRWISHRDLARLWERLIRRVRLKPSMSEGFHPKPRIGFPSALALGVIGLDEVVELDLAEELKAAELANRLRNDGQPGLEIISVVRLPEGFGKAKLARGDYRITIPDGVDLQELSAAMERLLTEETVTITRKKKPLTLNVSAQIAALEICSGELQLSLLASSSASLRPDDVLELLGAGDWAEKGAAITRTHVILENEFDDTVENNTDTEQTRQTDPLAGDEWKSSEQLIE